MNNESKNIIIFIMFICILLNTINIMRTYKINQELKIEIKNLKCEKYELSKEKCGDLI